MELYFIRAEYQTAHTLGEQLLSLALQAQEPVMLVAAHRAVGTTLFWRGVVASAQTHFAQGIALHDPTQHRAYAFLYGEDAGMICHIYAAWTLWILGYPDQGLTRSHEAVILAQQTAHPFSLGFALALAAPFHQFRREVRIAQHRAEAAISLATEQGFPFWLAFSATLRGWALAQQGQAQAGIAQIEQGLSASRATGAEIRRPYFLARLAEAYGIMGQPEQGLTGLAEAMTRAEASGDRWYEAEFYRRKGELLLQQNADNHAEAESCFQQAISIAQH
jgi:predicted ATPase